MDARCIVVFREFLIIYSIFCFLFSFCFNAFENLFKLLTVKCLELIAGLFKTRLMYTA